MVRGVADSICSVLEDRKATILSAVVEEYILSLIHI